MAENAYKSIISNISCECYFIFNLNFKVFLPSLISRLSSSLEKKQFMKGFLGIKVLLSSWEKIANKLVGDYVGEIPAGIKPADFVKHALNGSIYSSGFKMCGTRH